MLGGGNGRMVGRIGPKFSWDRVGRIKHGGGGRGWECDDAVLMSLVWADGEVGGPSGHGRQWVCLRLFTSRSPVKNNKDKGMSGL